MKKIFMEKSMDKAIQQYMDIMLYLQSFVKFRQRCRTMKPIFFIPALLLVCLSTFQGLDSRAAADNRATATFVVG